MILTGIFLYKTFSESSRIDQSQTTDDNISLQRTNIISNGGKIFKQNCASCHAIQKDVAGPALAGALNRGPWAQDKKNIYEWIRNPAGFMAKSPYTQRLKIKYGVMMTSFPDLSEKEIDEILDYIKAGAPEAVID